MSSRRRGGVAEKRGKFVTDDERHGEAGLKCSSRDADEQGDVRLGGVGGAKSRARREFGKPEHAPDTGPGKRVTSGRPDTALAGRLNNKLLQLQVSMLFKSDLDSEWGLTMKKWNFLLAIFLSMILSACSGSSNMSATEEPAMDPLSGLYKVVAQTNSVKATNFYINGNQIPLESCGRDKCTAQGGFLASLTETAIVLADDGFVIEAEIGGVEIVRPDRTDINDDWRLLGGWMDYSAFFVNKYIHTTGSSTFLVYPQSIGRLYLNDNAVLPVAGSASYEGAMVGTNIMTAERYTGQSSMTANFGEAPTIDIHFTDIMNVSTGDSHSDISYAGVSISDRKGIYGIASDRSYVNGEFAGPDNEEVVGVFEHEDLIGAFGAKRTE